MSSSEMIEVMDSTDDEIPVANPNPVAKPAEPQHSKTRIRGGKAAPLVFAPAFDASEVLQLHPALLVWYRAHRRKLPWRGDDPPYGNIATPTATIECNSIESRTTVDSGSDLTTTNEPLSNREEGPPACTGGPSDDAFAGESSALNPKVSAYGTWISEVMLQQTRVDTVIPYWLKWMEKYPTVSALANASEEQVFALWSGLGYYRRASNLLKGAQRVLEKWKGVMPATVEELKDIPGIGDYTAGAVASIAFGLPVPLVDGNVVRVLSRWRGWSEDAKSPALAKKCWAAAAEIVATEAPGEWNQVCAHTTRTHYVVVSYAKSLYDETRARVNLLRSAFRRHVPSPIHYYCTALILQALMELGATVCTPGVPDCLKCPIRPTGRCRAFETAAENVSTGRWKRAAGSVTATSARNPATKRARTDRGCESDHVDPALGTSKKQTSLLGFMTMSSSPAEPLVSGMQPVVLSASPSGPGSPTGLPKLVVEYDQVTAYISEHFPVKPLKKDAAEHFLASYVFFTNDKHTESDGSGKSVWSDIRILLVKTTRNMAAESSSGSIDAPAGAGRKRKASAAAGKGSLDEMEMDAAATSPMGSPNMSLRGALLAGQWQPISSYVSNPLSEAGETCAEASPSSCVGDVFTRVFPTLSSEACRTSGDPFPHTSRLDDSLKTPIHIAPCAAVKHIFSHVTHKVDVFSCQLAFNPDERPPSSHSVEAALCDILKTASNGALAATWVSISQLPEIGLTSWSAKILGAALSPLWKEAIVAQSRMDSAFVTIAPVAAPAGQVHSPSPSKAHDDRILAGWHYLVDRCEKAGMKMGKFSV